MCLVKGVTSVWCLSTLSQWSIIYINTNNFTIMVEYYKILKILYKCFDDTYGIFKLWTGLENQCRIPILLSREFKI